jgi:hypothetical protein
MKKSFFKLFSSFFADYEEEEQQEEEAAPAAQEPVLPVQQPVLPPALPPAAPMGIHTPPQGPPQLDIPIPRSHPASLELHKTVNAAFPPLNADSGKHTMHSNLLHSTMCSDFEVQLLGWQGWQEQEMVKWKNQWNAGMDPAVDTPPLLSSLPDHWLSSPLWSHPSPPTVSQKGPPL